MTITRDDIITLFDQLAGMGLRVPPAVDADPATAANSYHLVLGDLSRADLGGALMAFARSGNRFWPSAPELRAMVPREAAAKQDRSEEAWGLLLRMMGSPGSRELQRRLGDGEPWVQDPDLDRRMKHACTSVGGPLVLGRAHEDTLVAHRASFRRAFQSVQEREEITGKHVAIEMRGKRVVAFPGRPAAKLEG